MTDQNRPNQNANKSKAEGERWTSDDQTVRNADRDEAPEQLYDEGEADDAGGIANRPLTEEVRNQQDLPARGTTRDRTGDPNQTPRRYDAEDGEDPAMPSHDSSLNTKL